MSLHRITAGSGYDYLTRQVMSMDSTERGHTGLSSYYTEKGESPGCWVGSGLAGLEGLQRGDVVTAEQMQLLFGAGLHPLATERKQAADAAGKGVVDTEAVARLGQPFRVYPDDVSPFRIEVARRLDQLNTDRGRPRRAAVAIADRARIRTEVALEMFLAQHQRQPLDERELNGFVATVSRQKTTAVAGFDLTFSPVKSVSSLWAVADRPLAAAIERAHNAAVAEALRFVEDKALFTRTGRNGVQQVEVNGLIAAAFTHRDSRAGDPDLHTHVAVANKVQTKDGKWLSIDGRVLFKAIVAASETYNTALERHLAETIGVTFAERSGDDPRLRPIREIVGVDPALNERWSTRRASIEDRRRRLAAQFQADHHRPPTPVEAIALAQQATLETRDAKHEPRSLDQQRTTWAAQARQVLGGQHGIDQMIRRALNPTGATAGPRRDDAWIDATAHRILRRIQTDRATWQDWHVRGEALRVVRAANVPGREVPQVVDQLVAAALGRSVAIAHRDAGEPAEPAPLLRSTGESVYTVAGSQLFTSTPILAAEARLVEAAGQVDGRRIDPTAVDVALLECAANGLTLNAGQALLVREMATSGARVQLAIAPAGSGKTTAMNALSRAWTAAGGTVIGLAPSAAAAAALGEQLAGHTDTLAKLAWSLQHGDTPDWMAHIDAGSLIIIDEAGMADTLTLDAVVTHVLARGASVRLVGDDQQLAAIGAGGVLRDIHATHGALRLSELVRFTDRAEGAASLALRDGHCEALGFYLDQHRIHVGDQTTMVDDLFAAWTADRNGGADAIMLAPTRTLVAELNQRARSQRLEALAGQPVGPQVALADGNHASAGDVVITRLNNRRLRSTSSDWVKNGDRWTITTVHGDGALDVQHTHTGRHVRLPADYTTANVELGYACTTHTAQGVTADHMHGLLTGDESRQHAYTMLTRGRNTNHAYLVVVGDGNEHTTIRPETINPLTPTDVLEQILARDESPLSATTSLRQAADPATRLANATARYADAVTFAAHHTAGEHATAEIQALVEQVLPDITSAERWPALRAQLLLAHAHGLDPYTALAQAVEQPVLAAQDPCSVIAWRIATALRHHDNQPGPLPWLTPVPQTLADHPMWGPYLTARAQLVDTLAGQVHHNAVTGPAPAWVAGLTARPTADLIADVTVWRSAMAVPDTDLRPLGDRQPGTAEARWQRQLQRRLTDSQTAAWGTWRPVLHQLNPDLLTDPYAPTLAARLSQLAGAGINARHLLDAAAAQGPLPDDHAAAALWWRLARHLSPAVAEAVAGDQHLTAAWLDTFADLVGAERATQLQGSTWWPALVATMERGLQRGWTLDQLTTEAGRAGADGHADIGQAWVWRLSLLTDLEDVLDIDLEDVENPAPDDLYDGWEPSDTHQVQMNPAEPVDIPAPAGEPVEPRVVQEEDLIADDDQILAVQALLRSTMGAPEPTDAQVREQLRRADVWRGMPVDVDRIAQINQMAADFYAHCLPGSWARPYLAGRFGTDLTGHPHLQPGYAPDTWTALTTHLKRRGVSDTDLVLSGLVGISQTGRIYDRFRDRAVFPIRHQGRVLGFVGRRHPDAGDTDNKGPKYLNTGETPLFVKGDQLFVAGDLAGTATPVIVEGPMDAIAVTLATDGRQVGVAPLGTSLTEPQVAQLAAHPVQPVVATDADPAGRKAAERDFWLLALYNLNPTYAPLPDGADPASLIADGHTEQLQAALATAQPLAHTLIDHRLTSSSDAAAILDAVRILAAQPPSAWTAGAEHIATTTRQPAVIVRSALAAMVKAHNQNPRRAIDQALAATAQQAKKNTAPAAGRVTADGHYETVTAPELHRHRATDPTGPTQRPDRGVSR